MSYYYPTHYTPYPSALPSRVPTHFAPASWLVNSTPGHYYRTTIAGVPQTVLFAGYNSLSQAATLVSLTPTGLQLLVVSPQDLVGWTNIGPNLNLLKSDPLCGIYPWAFGC
ncbi:hypothetical protein LOZ80_20795 [Paenibacillus sp. HWE-109]|uniref:hypothetical protein n=1 Tax=Paenibacillus sp. HWE-109 TaxID=1306526 RepID=UPI001EDCD8DB|nr:hypothetical protein [Paenibacillus sp. HWE-109]UKS24076.1 hypothetical protein LOZ80_20795 [Paenibacillus sp. HWE-109]